MPTSTYAYIVVGTGLAGASAIAGIRENDSARPIALFGEEKELPYDRPPLSKKLWFGSMPIEKVFIHNRKYYEDNHVDLKLGDTITDIDPAAKTVTDASGTTYGYGKLLLATGGRPRVLPVPGGDLEGICYYRSLADFKRLRAEARAGRTAVIVGGGFIGSEIAAALTINKVKVTMVFPDPYPCARVFPKELGRAMQEEFAKKGVRILCDRPIAFLKKDQGFVTRTEKNGEIESDMVVVGVGITPDIRLAQRAGLAADNGVVVNEFLETSRPDVYAAGDIANFPCHALGKRLRLEHWDNALAQGRYAGKNMAGANERFDYLPYFFSDLFEFGYEAVGEVDSSLPTFADWEEPNRKGVIYYLAQNRVRGVMLCNVWDRIESARHIIVAGEQLAENELRGALR